MVQACLGGMELAELIDHLGLAAIVTVDQIFWQIPIAGMVVQWN